MKIICGLGNIGKEYLNTRHNLGFEVIDALACKLDVSLKDFETIAYTAKAFFFGEPIMLIKPKLFVNRSGIVLRRVLDYYKVEIENVLVVIDDFNLDLDCIRFRSKGSDGGHNGLKSIITNLKTTDFSRLRMGIGPLPKNVPVSNFVLTKFKKKEQESVRNMLEISSDAVCDWVTKDTAYVMNKYN